MYVYCSSVYVSIRLTFVGCNGTHKKHLHISMWQVHTHLYFSVSRLTYHSITEESTSILIKT